MSEIDQLREELVYLGMLLDGAQSLQEEDYINEQIRKLEDRIDELEKEIG